MCNVWPVKNKLSIFFYSFTEMLYYIGLALSTSKVFERFLHKYIILQILRIPHTGFAIKWFYSFIVTWMFIWLVIPENRKDRWRSGESYPSGEGLKDGGQGVVLQLEKLRRLAVHLERVGVVVELHRADEVTPAGHHVGELGESKFQLLHAASDFFIINIVSLSNDDRHNGKKSYNMYSV